LIYMGVFAFRPSTNYSGPGSKPSAKALAGAEMSGDAVI
jgi:hypothetical protein